MLVKGRPHRGTESQEVTRREAGAWIAHPLCPSFGPLPPAGPCCSAGCAAKGRDPFPALGSSSGGCLGIRRAGPAATKGPGQPHGGAGIKEPAFDTPQGATHHEGHVTHVFHQPLTWLNQTWPGKGPLAAGVKKATAHLSEEPIPGTPTGPAAGEGVGRGGQEGRTRDRTWKAARRFSPKETLSPCTLARALFSRHPQKLHAYIHTKTCTRMLLAALFITAKTWKHPGYPSVAGRTDGGAPGRC